MDETSPLQYVGAGDDSPILIKLKELGIMFKVMVYECEGSISLDEQFLKNMAGGKFPVRMMIAVMDEETHQELQRRASRAFNFAEYDSLVADGNDEQAMSIFESGDKSLPKDSWNIATFRDCIQADEYIEEESI